MAVMVAVVTGGFHGISSYQWTHNEQIMEEDIFPVIYVTEPGIYKCSIYIDPTIAVGLKFIATCKEHSNVHN